MSASAIVSRRRVAVAIGVVGDVIDPRLIVVRLRIIYRLRRPFRIIPRRTLEIILEALARAAATHVLTHEIAVTVIPLRPTGVA